MSADRSLRLRPNLATSIDERPRIPDLLDPEPGASNAAAIARNAPIADGDVHRLRRHLVSENP